MLKQEENLKNKTRLDKDNADSLKQMLSSSDDNDFKLACEILKHLDFNDLQTCDLYVEILGHFSHHLRKRKLNYE